LKDPLFKPLYTLEKFYLVKFSCTESAVFFTTTLIMVCAGFGRQVNLPTCSLTSPWCHSQRGSVQTSCPHSSLWDSYLESQVSL